MNHGDKVEVNDVWASNGACRAPSRAWFGGYTFESTDGVITKVRMTKGVLAGCVVNFPSKDVRPEVQSEPEADVVSS